MNRLDPDPYPVGSHVDIRVEGVWHEAVVVFRGDLPWMAGLWPDLHATDALAYRFAGHDMPEWAWDGVVPDANSSEVRPHQLAGVS